MTIKHIAWPSIVQFRDVVKHVARKSQFMGLDENGEPIINRLAPKPTLQFEGTVKLHGTNASFCVSYDNEVWVQSRENIITPEKDNAGFAMFCKGNEDTLLDLIGVVVVGCIIDYNTHNKTVAIYGEWCGGSIQKGVALNQLPKMFVVFGIALVDEEGNKEYLPRNMIEEVFIDFGQEKLNEHSIYSIYQFPTWTIDIDFENPHEAVETLNKLTSDVEAECPVGKAFDVSGIGEGIVWRCIEEGKADSGYFFKVKGEKHANSKVKTLAAVDVEKINNIKALAERLAHNGRLEQGLQVVFDTLNGGEPDIKRTGEFIKWVMQDIFKEDIDIVAASGYNGKEISGTVSKIARDFLLKHLEV